MVVTVVQSVLTGLNTVCLYKLPYYIYEGNSHGFMSAMSGLLSNILSLLIVAVACQLYCGLVYWRLKLLRQVSPALVSTSK